MAKQSSDAKVEIEVRTERICAALNNLRVAFSECASAFDQAARAITVAEAQLRNADGDDDGPHSRACGITPHKHGRACSMDCPTCFGHPLDEGRAAIPDTHPFVGSMNGPCAVCQQHEKAPIHQVDVNLPGFRP